MKLHMDGARIANAAATLGVPLRAFTTRRGVDVLSFGGTKNGMLYGEAVVVLNPEASEGLIYLRKLNMQLASKMRFISAQLIALLTDDLWLRSASHANAMATRLRAALEAGIADGSIQGVGFSQQTQANGVFATLPGRRRRPAPRALPVLRLGCGQQRGALDVLVRHHRARHRRFRRSAHPGTARGLNADTMTLRTGVQIMSSI